MALNQLQIEQFTQRAKKAGFSDDQIKAEISRKSQELSAPAATSSATTQPQVTAPATQAPATTQAPVTGQPSPTVQMNDPEQAVRSQGFSERLGNFAIDTAKSLTAPFARTGKNILGAGVEGFRKGALDVATKLDAGQADSQMYETLVRQAKRADEAGQTEQAKQLRAKAKEKYGGAKLAIPGVAGVSGAIADIKNPFLDEQQLEKVSQPLSLNPESAARQQLADSTNIASYAIPFGKGANILTKAAVPGATVGAMQAASQAGDRDVSGGELLGGALLGAALPTAVAGAGSVKNAAQNTVRGIQRSLSNKAAQGINKSTPAAYDKAIEKGIDINDLTTRYFPQGGSYDDVLGTVADRGRGGVLGAKLKEAENVIQSTADIAGKNIRLSGDDIISGLKTELKSMSGELGGTNREAALKKIISEAEKKYKNGMTVKQALTTLRSANEKFGKSIVDDAGDAVASAAQKLEANTLRETLKKMFPDIGDALRTQEEIYTLRPILSRARATSNTQGSTIRTGQISEINWANPFTYGKIVDAAAQSPSLASRLLRSENTLNPLKESVKGGILSDIPGNLSGQVFSRTGLTAGGMTLPDIGSEGVIKPTENTQYDENDSKENVQFNNENNGADNKAVDSESFLPDIVQDKPQTLNPYGASPEEIYREYVSATEFGDKKTADFLKKMYDDEVAYQKNSNPKNKARSASSLQIEGKAKSGLEAIELLENMLANPESADYSPDVAARSQNIPNIDLLKGQDRKLYESAVSSLIDAIGGLRTGASVSKEQQVFYDRMLPKAGDDAATIKRKLDAVRAELQGYVGLELYDPMVDGTLPNIPQ